MTCTTVSKEAAEEALLRRFNHSGNPYVAEITGRQFNAACEELKRQHLALPLDAVSDPGPFREVQELSKPDDTTTASNLVEYAAWLAGGQHGFAAVAEIPELQQIIAYTCMDVLQKFACRPEQQGMQQLAGYRDNQCRAINNGCQSLLDSLTPQLRICLLAEVAAGLICPGQRLPPDTPEHAAALLAFLDQSVDHVKTEIQQDLAAQTVSAQRALGSSPLAQAIERSTLEQQQAADDHLLASFPSHGMSSPLAPQMDLQLQVPPHILLEAFLLSLPGGRVHEQERRRFRARYQLNDAQWDGLVFLFQANPSLVAMDKVASQVTHAVRAGTQATAAASSGQSVGSQVNSSSSSGEAAARCAGASWQLLHDAACASSKHPVLGLLLQGLPEANSASSLANHILQLLTTSAAIEGQSGAIAEGFIDHLKLLAGALVLQFLAAARAAGGVAWQQEVPLQVLLLLAALEQLQGMCLVVVKQQQVEDAAVRKETWQQHVGCVDSSSSSLPLGQTSTSKGSLAAVGTLGAGCSSPDTGDGCATCHENCNSQPNNQAGQGAVSSQQQPHQQCQDNLTLQAVLQKVVAIVQMVRDYRSANAAVNAAAGQPGAAGDMGTASAAAPASAACGLAPDSLFGVSSPLTAGYPEPHGCGVWGQAAAADDISNSSRGDSKHKNSTAIASAGAAAPQQQLGNIMLDKAVLTVQAMAASGMLQQKVQQVSDTLQEQLAGDLADDLAAAAAKQLDRQQHYGLQDIDRKRTILQVCRQYGLDRVQQWECGALEDVPAAVAGVFVQHWTSMLGSAGVPGGSGSVMQHDRWQGDFSRLNGRYTRAPYIREVRQGKEALQQLYHQQASQVLQPLQVWLQEQAAVWQKHIQHHKQQTEQMKTELKNLSDIEWLPGYNSACSRCHAENKQQQQVQRQLAAQPPDATVRSSDCSSPTQQQQRPYSSWPVSYSDPFMWRRLVWQLLGKIKPAAQAWFLHEKNVCPHCTDYNGCWSEVLRSIALDLWTDPAGDGLSHVLLYKDWLQDNTVGNKLELKDRYFFVKHYARVANLAYSQSYSSPAAVLLSQQVLLSLSPLHQQMLPHPEAAPLCPSSAGAAVCKALMVKLGVGQSLWDFRHEAVQVDMWHVWWHVGIRRYHWIKQQQRQQYQPGSGSSSGQGQLMPLSSEVLQELYNDPDARYYAVGFASRQLAPSEQPSLAATTLQQQQFISQVSQQLLQVCHSVRVQKLAGINLRFATAADMASQQLGVLCQDADVISRLLVEELLGSSYKGLAAGGVSNAAVSRLLFGDQHVAAAVAAGKGCVGIICGIVSGVADSGHVQQAALLPPLAAELWLHPREWCQRRAAAMRDAVCSWCEAQPCVEAEGIFDTDGWGHDKVDSKVVCRDCHSFFCCSPRCLAKLYIWHNAICAALCKCRERYRGTPRDLHNTRSSSKQSPLTSRVTYNASSSSSSSRWQGYQWHVLDLLQWGDQPACEPGPLGVNCLGLLTAHHESGGVLVLADMHWRKALRRGCPEAVKQHFKQLASAPPGLPQLPGLPELSLLSAAASSAVDPSGEQQQILDLLLKLTKAQQKEDTPSRGVQQWV